MIELMIGLFGIVFGLLLGKLTTLEIVYARKYLINIRRFFMIIPIYFVIIKHYFMILVGLLFLVGLFLFFDIKKNKFSEIFSYLVFLIVFFVMIEFQDIIASTLFVYGLFAGSLLWLRKKA